MRLKSCESKDKPAGGTRLPGREALSGLAVGDRVNPAATILALQRTHGNRFSQGVILDLMKQGIEPVSRANDRHEQEAERVALRAISGSSAWDVHAAVGRQLGADLSVVRIHTDTDAAGMSRDVSAKAFTVGEHIYFGAGEFAPQSDSGRRLLAHELVHVAQQRRGGTPLIQRDPQARVEPPTAETMRDYVDDVMEMLRLGAEMYRGAAGPRSTPVKVDASTVQRQLGGWKTALTTAITAIQNFLNNDPARTQNLKQVYQDAVQAFVRVAAPQAGQTTHEFYQANLGLIHEWAWPQSGASLTRDELSQGIPASEAHPIRVMTASATISNLDDLFSTQVATTTISLPGGVTARFASGIPTSLQHGLSNVAGELSTGMTPPALEANSTITLALDLEKYGSDYAAYRFTWVVHHPPHGASTQEILIEKLGTIGVEALAPSERASLQAKFDQHHFVRGNGYSEPQFDAVLAAISQIPDAVLTPIDGITFQRDTASATDPEAGGDYSPTTHTITMYDRGFTPSMMRTGVPGMAFATESVRAVRHEVGHALDLLPLRQAAARVDVAQQNLRTAFAQYETPPGSGNFRFPSSEQANFNHLQQLITAAEQGQSQARSVSGHRWQANAQGVQEIVQGGTAAGSNEFRLAAQQDGGVRVTHYSDKEWGEYFAESYSLYVTDPGALQRLRPHVFAVLQRRFPR